jgi:hypothetical protein
LTAEYFAMVPTGQARPAVIYNDLAALLPNWEISL